MKYEIGNSFKGFSKEALDFLVVNRFNNSKQWFEENRHNYEEHLLKPMQALVADLSGTMLSIDPSIVVIPSIGKTISRIYRDTRFSKDKSLFRDTMWINFKRPSKEWQDAPGFFFEISPGSYRYGMGFYSASSDSMNRFRKAIDEKPDEFNEIISFYYKQNTFTLEGDKYKKPLAVDKTPEILEWYQRKNLYLVCNRQKDEHIFSRNIVKELADGFCMLKGLYNCLFSLKIGE